MMLSLSKYIYCIDQIPMIVDDQARSLLYEFFLPVVNTGAWSFMVLGYKVYYEQIWKGENKTMLLWNQSYAPTEWYCYMVILKHNSF